MARKTASANGVYTLAGHRYRIRKGDPLPEGATFEAATAPDPEARALKSAPENKAKASAPETKSKASKKDDD